MGLPGRASHPRLLALLFAVSSRRWNQAQTNDAAPVSTSPPSPNERRRHLPPQAVAGLLLAAVDCGPESVVGLWAFVFLLEEVTLLPAIAGAVVSGYWAALVIGRVLLGSVAARTSVAAGGTTSLHTIQDTTGSSQQTLVYHCGIRLRAPLRLVHRTAHLWKHVAAGGSPYQQALST